MQITGISQRKHKVMALYVISALLFQLYLLATLSLNPSQVHNNNWLAQAQGEKVLLCTAEGFKWVDINELIEDNNSTTLDSNEIHDPLKFSCPLLDVCQLVILVAALVLVALTQWLCRTKANSNPPLLILCQQRIYLSLAPKQSPPQAFLA
ncbi:hypothetical protein SE23_13290 [Vibrio sinaloensis]|uniref:hypothetical protein n=1 Tax=Photobacterium sp. (strain ATCC 43367) TaxID=379097 RepID=UPI00057FE22B|nr:hypothetical protein SE23_13290 [Vibrio sinaloensis]